MAKAKEAERVTMYNINERGEVVTHHLPWPKGSEKYERLKARGFTFDYPVPERGQSISVPSSEEPPTTQDKRGAALKKARDAKAAKKGV